MGQILGLHCFPKNTVGRFLSVMSLMIFTLSMKLTFIRTTRILFPQSRAPRKFILRIFKEYFVVCPVEFKGINNMLICPILTPYVKGPHGWSISVTMIMPLSSVTRSGWTVWRNSTLLFRSAVLIIANENVDLPVLVDHGWIIRTTSNYIISLEYSTPRPMQLS